MTTAPPHGARTPHPTPAVVAQALADAFLGAPAWTVEELLKAGALTLWARRRWLGALATSVIASYPRPPVDAPRELAATIAAGELFRGAVATAQRTGAPLPLLRYPLTPARPGNHPGAVAQLANLGALAELLHLSGGELEWFADVKHLNRLAPATLQHYRYTWHRRPGRVPRLLEIPAPRLRTLQRTLLRELLAPLPLHPAAHGFVPGRNVITGAALHTGRATVVTVDLSTFFARVTPGRVYGVLRRAGYPEAVAHRLTGLCTHRVPPAVLQQMPPGGDPAARFALRQALSVPHLPQGAPTSPTLANLAVRRLDSRLAGWAGAFDAQYTRYADDLTFSGDHPLLRSRAAFLERVARIVQQEGHALNPAKTRIRGAGARQQVTGIVVNTRPTVARREVDALKATLHNCVVHGPTGQNRSGHPDFAAHLRGRIAWVAAVHPDRGARLLALFDQIAWPD